MHSIASASECIPWLVVLIIECLAIVILNIITIVVLVKMKRQLQRRSTYLIIHQAIVDLLVGAVSLFVICVSYILVVIKVRCSRHLQFHSRSKRERKLTGTALIVSLVSLLCFIPAIIYTTCCGLSLNYFQNAHIYLAVLVLFYANSLVNPIIYALRMPGFREGLLQLFYRVPDLSRIASANLPLRNLRRA